MKYLLMFLLAFSFTAQAKVVNATKPEQVKAALAKGGPVLVMYGTEWCPACKEARPLFNKASNQIKGVTFLHMDTDHVVLLQHKDLFNYIPFYVYGRTEDELRNHPCVQPDDLDRSPKGLQKFIDSCNKK